MPSTKWIVCCNIFLALIMSIILSVCFTVGQGHPITLETLDALGFTFVIAFVVSLVVAFGAQLPRIGHWYVKQVNGQPHTTISWVFESTIQVVFFLVIVNLCMTFAMTGVGELGGFSWFDRWWQMNMQFFPVALIAFFVTRPIAEGLANKVAGSPAPAKAVNGVVQAEI